MSDPSQNLRVIEALLFATREPMPEAALAAQVPDDTDLATLLAQLADHYAERGVNLVKVAGGWALRTAEPSNVLGDFGDVSVELEGVAVRFSVKGGKYFAELVEGGSEPTEYEIKYTIGVEPLQQYLVETRNGRLQALDLAWDTEQRRWFHLYPDAVAGPGDGFH